MFSSSLPNSIDNNNKNDNNNNNNDNNSNNNNNNNDHGDVYPSSSRNLQATKAGTSVLCPYRLLIAGGGPAGTAILVRALRLGGCLYMLVHVHVYM
jgi:hypothetical protein